MFAVALTALALTGTAAAVPVSGGTPAERGIGPPGARQLRLAVLANARAAGLEVRSARVLPVGGGVLDVVVRLREEQLLDQAAHRAVATLFGPTMTKPGALHYLSIEAPDGTSLAYGGTFMNGGNWSYGGDTGRSPVPSALPRALRTARADLVVHMTRATALGGERTYRIVCGGSVPAPGSRCGRVLADRWALLVPTMPGFTCAGGIVGGWSVSIEGELAGRRVSRAYDGCYVATTLRWARFLGLA